MALRKILKPGQVLSLREGLSIRNENLFQIVIVVGPSDQILAESREQLELRLAEKVVIK